MLIRVKIQGPVHRPLTVVAYTYCNEFWVLVSSSGYGHNGLLDTLTIFMSSLMNFHNYCSRSTSVSHCGIALQGKGASQSWSDHHVTHMCMLRFSHILNKQDTTRSLIKYFSIILYARKWCFMIVTPTLIFTTHNAWYYHISQVRLSPRNPCNLSTPRNHKFLQMPVNLRNVIHWPFPMWFATSC